MGTYCADSFGLVAHPTYPSPLAERTLFRQTPEVGARCVNRARRDLCGGYSVRGIPTAIMAFRFYRFGILSSNIMVNRLSADFQSLIGIVHFFAMFFRAKKSSLNIASSLGKCHRFIDGTNLFFLAGIQMQVNGIVTLSGAALQNEVERQTQRELFSLIRRSGTGAFAVTVNEASDIEVLTSPARIMVRRKGVWSIFDPDIFRAFLSDCIEAEAAEDLIWTLYALSKMRYGTVVMIYGGSGRKLAELKKGAVGGADPIGRLLIERVKKKGVGELKQSGTLLRILSSDGITVFNSKGKLVDTGFIIDTSHAREMVAGGGRTTASCAASHFGKVIKVSQDGPIELYENGTQIYRFG